MTTDAGAPWWRKWPARFGYRNIAYLAFVLALIPFGMQIEAAGSTAPEGGGGLMVALVFWAIGSFGFFAVNAILVVVALIKKGTVAQALIACALPFLVALAVLASEEFLMY